MFLCSSSRTASNRQEVSKLRIRKKISGGFPWLHDPLRRSDFWPDDEKTQDFSAKPFDETIVKLIKESFSNTLYLRIIHVSFVEIINKSLVINDFAQMMPLPLVIIVCLKSPKSLQISTKFNWSAKESKTFLLHVKFVQFSGTLVLGDNLIEKLYEVSVLFCCFFLLAEVNEMNW